MTALIDEAFARAAAVRAEQAQRRSAAGIEAAITAVERGTRKRAISLEDRPHGVTGTYVAGCRCHECKTAIRVYRKERAAAIQAGTVEVAHGTVSSYNAGCHCRACCQAATAVKAARRVRWRAEFAAGQREIEHGTATAYREYGCRCSACSAANTADCCDRKRVARFANRQCRELIDVRNAQWREEQLARAQASADAEMAELIADQLADLDTPDRAPSWMVYLDAPIPHDDGESDRYEWFGGGQPRHLIEWDDPTLDAVLANG